jgi:Mce-associated membrane protein
MTVSDDVVIDELSPESEAEPTEDVQVHGERGERPKRRIGWSRMLAYGVLPALALLLAMGAGYLKWLDSSARDAQVAPVESVRTATDSTIAMLSYKPDTVEKDLGAARDRLTGNFKDTYASLTNDVVIPAAKQKQITAVANVAAAASVSASENHAVVLVFVNQTTTIGNEPPANTASSVRVTLDKIGGGWLISQFDPV